MIEYIYRGFKLSYKIEHPKQEKNSYTAAGFATYLLNVPKSFVPAKFHTEYDTHTSAEHEIKKLLENYVDFELKSFYEMKKEEVMVNSVVNE